MQFIADPALALERTCYDGPVEEVAEALLGQVLVTAHGSHSIIAGIIVETEAYGGADDPASHASFRKNGRVRAMWADAGTLYVYAAFGVYACFNIVTGPGGLPSAVLIRALRLFQPELDMNSASGPGRLGRQIGLSTDHNFHRLDAAPFWLQPGINPRKQLLRSPRVGVNRDDGRLWRFSIAGDPAVSRPRPVPGVRT